MNQTALNQLKLAANAAQAGADLALSEAQYAFSRINESVRDVRNNGTFVPGETMQEIINALDAAAESIQARAAEALKALALAREKMNTASTLKNIVDKAEAEK